MHSKLQTHVEHVRSPSGLVPLRLRTGVHSRDLCRSAATLLMLATSMITQHRTPTHTQQLFPPRTIPGGAQRVRAESSCSEREWLIFGREMLEPRQLVTQQPFDYQANVYPRVYQSLAQPLIEGCGQATPIGAGREVSFSCFHSSVPGSETCNHRNRKRDSAHFLTHLLIWHTKVTRNQRY